MNKCQIKFKLKLSLSSSNCYFVTITILHNCGWVFLSEASITSAEHFGVDSVSVCIGLWGFGICWRILATCLLYFHQIWIMISNTQFRSVYTHWDVHTWSTFSSYIFKCFFPTEIYFVLIKFEWILYLWLRICLHCFSLLCRKCNKSLLE